MSVNSEPAGEAEVEGPGDQPGGALHQERHGVWVDCPEKETEYAEVYDES